MELSAGKSPKFYLALGCWLSFQDTNVVWPILRSYMTNTRKIHWRNLNQRCLSSKLIAVDHLLFLLIDYLLPRESQKKNSRRTLAQEYFSVSRFTV